MRAEEERRRRRCRRPNAAAGYLEVDELLALQPPLPEGPERDVTQPVAPSPEVQRILTDVYRRDPALSGVCERLVDTVNRSPAPA